MTRVLVTADLHLHPWSDHRKAAGLDFVRHLVRVSTKRAVDAVVICGDTFHCKDGHSVGFLVSIQKVFRKFQCPVYILDGNHDHDAGDAWSAIEILSPRPRVKILRKPTLVRLGDYWAQMVPYQYTLGELQDSIEPMTGEDGERARLLFGHCGIDGAFVGPFEKPFILPSEKALPVDSILRHSYDAAFFGHYHKPQKYDGGVWIVGSPLQHTVAERGDRKRFLLLELDDGVKVKSIPYHGPIFQDVAVRSEEDLSPGLKDLDITFLRVRLLTADITPTQVHDALDSKCLAVKVIPYSRTEELGGEAGRIALDLDDAKSVEQFVSASYTSAKAREEGVDLVKLTQHMTKTLAEARTEE